MTARSRAWCFTVNNPTELDVTEFLCMDYRYFVLGFEEGENGTPHWQGYVSFQDAKTMTSVKKRLSRAHWEIAKGTPIQNYEYCTKGGDFVDDGELPSQGRITWERLEEVMQNPRENPALFHQYRKAYKEIKSTDRQTERSLYLAPCERQFKIARKCESEPCFNVSHYDGEQAMILYGIDYEGTDEFSIVHWKEGYPPKIKRGYELITIDPAVVYLLYRSDIERSVLRKKYYNYIDGV